MRQVLSDAFPNDAILGEEHAARAGTSGRTWVLDPIDGTRGFISGTPTWGTLIGLRDGDRIAYGLIDQPFTGERFEGWAGGATWTRGADVRPLRTRGTTGLGEATILSTFPEVGTPSERAAFERLAGACRLTRYGLDCYGYALVALGCVDLVVEAGLHPYDVAGPIGVVEGAGGIVTAWDGGPALDGGRVVAAANAEIHAAALAYLAG